eukprot:SAG31_NODE_44545_length_262_cov_0.920245_1_plen_42_part_10
MDAAHWVNYDWVNYDSDVDWAKTQRSSKTQRSVDTTHRANEN